MPVVHRLALAVFVLMHAAACGFHISEAISITKAPDVGLAPEAAALVPKEEDKRVFPIDFKSPAQEVASAFIVSTKERTDAPREGLTTPTISSAKSVKLQGILGRSTETLPYTPAHQEKDGERDLSLSYHRREFDRIQSEVEELERRLQQAQEQLGMIDATVTRERQAYEEQFQRVMQSSLPSPRSARVRNLSCMGWKHTGGCKWTGERELIYDKSCFSFLADEKIAGYCVVHDSDTDEYFRVMRSDCGSSLSTAVITCRVAPYFANFPAEIERAILAADDKPQRVELTGDGIVVVLRPSEIHEAMELVQSLRALKCELPVELWLAEDDADSFVAELRLRLTQTNLVDVEIRPMISNPSRVAARIHAITHSAFENVLYLDVASTPLRDPTYLFSHPEFLSSGTLFWPDVFHPRTTQSYIHATSLLWEYLDMEFVNMFEQDDRQLLIRRDLIVQRGLRVAELFATHQPDLFNRMNLVHEGKEFFRLAWLKTRVPFHMVAVPPTLAGSSRGSLEFCGSHVVQHDPNGEQLFLHRQRDADPFLSKTIDRIQEFDWRRKTQGNGEPRERLSDLEMLQLYDVERRSVAGDDASRCYAFTRGVGDGGRVSTRLWNGWKRVTSTGR